MHLNRSFFPALFLSDTLLLVQIRTLSLSHNTHICEPHESASYFLVCTTTLSSARCAFAFDSLALAYGKLRGKNKLPLAKRWNTETKKPCALVKLVNSVSGRRSYVCECGVFLFIHFCINILSLGFSGREKRR